MPLTLFLTGVMVAEGSFTIPWIGPMIAA